MNDAPAPMNHRPAAPRRFGIRALLLLGLLSLLGYLYLLRLSLEPLQPDNLEPAFINEFLGVMAFLFACYGFLVVPLVRGRRMEPSHLGLALGMALVFRAVLLPSELILENDIYRYLWDGAMMQQGINPYQYAPADPETEPYRTEYWPKINYKEVPTIYPPTLQYLFWLTQGVFPGSVMGMKLVLLLFDAAAIFVLLALLKKLGKPPEWCLIYAWSPLVLKELANSGHADAVSVFLLTALLWLTVNKRFWWSAVVCALLTLTKFFGVLMLPLFWRRWRWRHYGVFALTAAGLYLPFIDPNMNPFAGFVAYSKEWRFNAGVFLAVQTMFENTVGMIYLEPGWRRSLFLGETMLTGSVMARYFLFGVILSVTAGASLWLRQRPLNFTLAVFIVLGTLLMASPVIDPWYLSWLVPLICLHPSWAWLLFTCLVYLSYTFYFDYTFPIWMKPVEFGGFFAVLLAEWGYLFWLHRR